MLRKSATCRLRSLAGLRSQLEAAGRDLDRRLARRPAARAAAEAAGGLDYRPVFDHWLAELDRADRRLTEAEYAYESARSWLRECRQERDSAVTELRHRQAPIRRLVDALHDGLFQAAGITGAAPRDPFALIREVALMASLLGDLDSDPGEPAVDLGVELPDLAAGLGSATAKLDDACTALAREHHANATARCRADAATEEAARVESAIAGSLEGLCRLAGQDVLIQGIRRRRGTPAHRRRN